MHISITTPAFALGLLAATSLLARTASAGQNDDFYAAYPYLPATLYRFDGVSGNTITIGNILNIEPTDVAMSPSGVLYATTIDELYIVDAASAWSYFVGPVFTFNALEGLDFSSTGTLYATTWNGSLMTIDPATGISSPMFNLPNVTLCGDIAWSNATTLYAIVEGNALMKVDISGGGNHVTLGTIVASETFVGLDFDVSGNLIATTNLGDVYRIPNYTSSGAGVLQSSFGQFTGGLTSAGNSCPAIKTYCTSAVTSSGCSPSISGTGTPSATASSGFTITVSSVETQKQGILFYGLNNSYYFPPPWGGGSSFLCVKAPTQRMGAQNSGGAGTCGGTLSIDWNAFISSNPGALGTPMAPGQPIFAQGWFRDPPAPKTTNLSNGLSFIVCP